MPGCCVPKIEVHYIDNDYAEMRKTQWPVRLVEILDVSQTPAHGGMIGPWHKGVTRCTIC